MKKILRPKFDHEKQTINEAIGISKKDLEAISELGELIVGRSMKMIVAVSSCDDDCNTCKHKDKCMRYEAIYIDKVKPAEKRSQVLEYVYNEIKDIDPMITAIIIEKLIQDIIKGRSAGPKIAQQAIGQLMDKILSMPDNHDDTEDE